MSAVNQPAKHQFSVSIGVKLPPETVKRITQAIQKSVLSELASAEINTPLAIDFLTGAQVKAGAKSQGDNVHGIRIGKDD